MEVPKLTHCLPPFPATRASYPLELALLEATSTCIQQPAIVDILCPSIPVPAKIERHLRETLAHRLIDELCKLVEDCLEQTDSSKDDAPRTTERDRSIGIPKNKLPSQEDSGVRLRSLPVEQPFCDHTSASIFSSVLSSIAIPEDGLIVSDTSAGKTSTPSIGPALPEAKNLEKLVLLLGPERDFQALPDEVQAELVQTLHDTIQVLEEFARDGRLIGPLLPKHLSRLLAEIGRTSDGMPESPAQEKPAPEDTGGDTEIPLVPGVRSKPSLRDRLAPPQKSGREAGLEQVLSPKQDLPISQEAVSVLLGQLMESLSRTAQDTAATPALKAHTGLNSLLVAFVFGLVTTSPEKVQERPPLKRKKKDDRRQKGHDRSREEPADSGHERGPGDRSGCKKDEDSER